MANSVDDRTRHTTPTLALLYAASSIYYSFRNHKLGERNLTGAGEEKTDICIFEAQRWHETYCRSRFGVSDIKSDKENTESDMKNITEGMISL